MADNDAVKYIFAYWGEFLYHYAPMELSLKPCNYGCKYCFARANGYRNNITTDKIINWISNTYTKDTYLGYLMREGYPVVVSNRSDPFCKDNAPMMPILNDFLNDLNIPISWQTKGGESIFKMLDNVRPSHWYITLTTLDDKIRKQWEPNAPSIQHRIELIQELVRRGHLVEIGINPFVPEWLDTNKMIETMKSIGVKYACGFQLHLNNNQKRTVDNQDIVEVINRHDRETWERIYYAFEDNMFDNGLDMHSESTIYPETFFREYQKYYPKTFITRVEASTRIQEAHKYGVYLDFETFWSYIEDRLPDIRYNISSYIAFHFSSYYYQPILKNGVYGFKELMKLIWNNPKDKHGLLRCLAFGLMFKDKDNKIGYTGEKEARDKYGNLLYGCQKNNRNDWR